MAGFGFSLSRVRDLCGNQSGSLHLIDMIEGGVERQTDFGCNLFNRKVFSDDELEYLHAYRGGQCMRNQNHFVLVFRNRQVQRM